MVRKAWLINLHEHFPPKKNDFELVLPIRYILIVQTESLNRWTLVSKLSLSIKSSGTGGKNFLDSFNFGSAVDEAYKSNESARFKYYD